MAPLSLVEASLPSLGGELTLPEPLAAGAFRQHILCQAGILGGKPNENENVSVLIYNENQNYPGDQTLGSRSLLWF